MTVPLSMWYNPFTTKELRISTFMSNNSKNVASETIDGYISKIKIGQKTYALRCNIVEIHPIICPKCGASFELKYGNGRCDHCGTYFTTQFSLEEAPAV